jgi:hypothetical protein
MKRVLLLVFLMVSLAELALERDRIYLLFSTAALAGLVRTSLTSRQLAQSAPKLRAFVRIDQAGEGASASFSTEQGGAAYTTTPHVPADHSEKAESTRQSADGR